MKEKENTDAKNSETDLTTGKTLILLCAVTAGIITGLIKIALFFEIITIESNMIKMLISAIFIIGMGYYFLTILRNEYCQILEWLSLICFILAIVVNKNDIQLRLTMVLIAIGLAAQSAIPIVKRMANRNQGLKTNVKSSE